jgi:hypothetical protein
MPSELKPLPAPIGVARWTVGKQYLEGAYGDWLAHVSRFQRRWLWLAGWLGLATLIAGLVLKLPLLAAGLAGATLAQLVFSLTHRWFWLRKALKGKRLGRRIELHFRPEGFELHSDDEGCCLSYSVIQSYTLTPSALRLELGGGMRFAVLDRDLEPPTSKGQIAKILATNAGPATPRSIPVEAC